MKTLVNQSIVTKIAATILGIISISLILETFFLIKFEKHLVKSLSLEYTENIRQSILLKEQTEKAALNKNIQLNARLFAQASASDLYNIRPDDLKNSLRSYIARKDIIAIKVVDAFEEPFAAVWKSPEILTENDLPDILGLKNSPFFQTKSFKNGVLVGTFYVYYTYDLLEKKLKAEQEAALFKIAVFQKKTQTLIFKAVCRQVEAGCVIGIFLIICIIICMRFMIFKPLIRVFKAITCLSQLDLSIHLSENNKKNEIGRLMENLRQMGKHLRQIISSISNVSLNVNKSASDILAALETAAITAQEQSAAVSQISATMSELSQTSIEIAEHSDSVSKLGYYALKDVEEGADSVENVLLKMNDIQEVNEKNIIQLSELGEKSEDIANIVDIIKTIADQTKLIAFNAALESASAGEAGKRFGVVATEIRKFAGSVAESNENIEYKINDICNTVQQMIVNFEGGTKRIQEGVKYSETTAVKLRTTVKNVRDGASSIQKISQSTRQQMGASEQTAIALKEIDQGARAMAESMAQISLISKNLKSFSADLDDLIKKFKL